MLQFMRIQELTDVQKNLRWRSYCLQYIWYSPMFCCSVCLLLCSGKTRCYFFEVERKQSYYCPGTHCVPLSISTLIWKLDFVWTLKSSVSNLSFQLHFWTSTRKFWESVEVLPLWLDIWVLWSTCIGGASYYFHSHLPNVCLLTWEGSRD